jgi:adenosylmethionine-8-amino-7-oxononanoate aminotransferase
MTSYSRESLVGLDKRRVWHPYTEMGRYIASTDPLVVARTEGSRLFDVDGRSYIDANSSWFAATLGHNHPRLVATLKRQAETLCHCAMAGITNPEAALLADELCRRAPPGLERVFFSDDGSTAVEVAVKIAVKFAVLSGAPRRTRFVAMEDAFHGETVGATSLGGIEVFRRPFAGILFDCVRVPVPEARAYERAFEELGRALGRASDEIAAVVLEPRVLGAAGMKIYPDEYLRHVRSLCTRHDVPLIVDEVFTGYGRTGPMWACDAAGIAPDVLCLAKGFTGGILPMAATLVTERIFRAFVGEPSRALHYGHTYCGHPLGSAVAREVLRVYEDEHVLERARPKAERIAAAFEGLADLDCVASTRSLGMIGAADLVEPGGEAKSGYLATAGWRVYEAARRRGLYLRPLGNVVYVTPPLNISDADLEELLGKMRESIQEAMGS